MKPFGCGSDLNKTDLVENVSQALNEPFGATLKIVDRFLYEINHALIERKKITIANFGKFWVVRAKARLAKDLYRTPIKVICVPATYRIRFAPSKNVLKRVWNGKDR